MKAYESHQQMIDSVCQDLISCQELIGRKDETKEGKYGFIPGLNEMKNQEEALKEQVCRLREGVFQVLFTGGFSSGKSTLLNALMRKELLKMSIKAETAVITKIIFNADEKVIVYKKQVDGKGQRIKEEYTVSAFFEKFRVSQENPEMFKEIDYVQLQQSQDGIGGSLVQLVDSPGTSNSETDTEMARSFAKKASAIVYLINAVQPFTDEDKKYIKSHYAHKEIRNVFFVINRIDSVSPNEIGDLKESVKQHLTDVFTINGKFDEVLYAQRVFYTNAYGSLNTRTGRATRTPYGEFMIEDNQTGVPEFEHALGEFLSNDNRDRDAISAYIPKLSAIYSIAMNKVEKELENYKKGAEEIRKKSSELDASMDKIQKVLDAIESKCKNTAAELVREIKQVYDNYVSAVEGGWDQYFADENVLKEINFKSFDMIRLATTKDEKVKQEKMKPIQETIKKYIDSKGTMLKSNINGVIEAKMIDLESSLKNFQDQLENLDCPININQILKSINAAVTVDGTNAPDIKINSFQLILGIIGADPEVAIDAINGSKSNQQAIISSLTKNVFEYIAWNVVAWPLGIAMLLKRAYDMIKGWKDGGSNGAREIIKGLKSGTIQGLRSGKAELAKDVEVNVGGAVIRAGRTFSKSFHEELESYRKSFDEMLRNLDDKNFSIESESNRTRLILEEFIKHISHISELTDGKPLDAEGALRLAERI